MKRLLATFVIAASTAGALAAGGSAMPDPCCDDPGPVPPGYGLAALGVPTTSPAPFTTSAYGAPAAIATESTPASTPTSAPPLVIAPVRHATAKAKVSVKKAGYAKRIVDAANSANSYAEFSSWVQGHPAA
jgi:hypothetical protein